jgi:hypothetical protein
MKHNTIILFFLFLSTNLFSSQPTPSLTFALKKKMASYMLDAQHYLSEQDYSYMADNQKLILVYIPHNIQKIIYQVCTEYAQVNEPIKAIKFPHENAHVAPYEQTQKIIQMLCEILTAQDIHNEQQQDTLHALREYTYDLESGIAQITFEPEQGDGSAKRGGHYFNAFRSIFTQFLTAGSLIVDTSALIKENLNVVGNLTVLGDEFVKGNEVVEGNLTVSGTINGTTGGGTATSFNTDAGVATPIAGVINIFGGSNINTTGAGNTVTVNLDDTVSVSGSVTAGAGLIATAGGITATGNSSINTSGAGTTAIGTGTNTGTIAIGNTNSGAINIDCGTSGINVGATANNHITTLGSTSATNQTVIQGGAAPGGVVITTSGGSVSIQGEGITINGGSGNMNIATDATAEFVNIATGAANKVVTFGSTTGSITIQSGTGLTITGQAGSPVATFNPGAATAPSAPVFNSLTADASGTALAINGSNQLVTLVSSKRYKENFRSIGTLSELLYDLEPIIYDFKNGGGTNVVGFIAEDVEKILPTLVNHDKEGNVRSIRNDSLYALAIKELQKHQQEITGLKTTIAQLVAMTQQLQTTIDTLKKTSY